MKRFLSVTRGKVRRADRRWKKAKKAIFRFLGRGRPRRLRTVVPGVLYRCSLPDERGLRWVRRERNVRTVVSLLPFDHPREGAKLRQERALCEELGMQFVDLGFPADTIPSPRIVEAWLALLRDRSNHPVLVHCKHGAIRTGVLVAKAQIDLWSVPAKRALRIMPKYGHGLSTPDRRKLQAWILDGCESTDAVEYGSREDCVEPAFLRVPESS